MWLIKLLLRAQVKIAQGRLRQQQEEGALLQSQLLERTAQCEALALDLEDSQKSAARASDAGMRADLQVVRQQLQVRATWVPDGLLDRYDMHVLLSACSRVLIIVQLMNYVKITRVVNFLTIIMDMTMPISSACACTCAQRFWHVGFNFGI
jgi:hypothetical protein